MLSNDLKCLDQQIPIGIFLELQWTYHFTVSEIGHVLRFNISIHVLRNAAKLDGSLLPWPVGARAD